MNQDTQEFLDTLKGREEDLEKDETEELQKIVDETGLDVDVAFEIWEAV